MEELKSETEQRERESRVYNIQFDNSHFGDFEIPIDTLKLVGELNEWWDKICIESGINPNDKKIYKIGYHVIELGKNALEHAGGGTIKVNFERGEVTVIVTDQGQGFENPNDDILYGAPGHGLSEVKRYADEFIIETRGKKFVKVPKKRNLAISEETDIQQGSKITFVKKKAI